MAVAFAAGVAAVLLIGFANANGWSVSTKTFALVALVVGAAIGMAFGSKR